MSISLVMQWGFQLPAAWLLAFMTSAAISGVWWSYAVANVAATVIAVGWFLKGPWRRTLVDESPPRAAAPT
jgi:Na+-driven multidrug efflux pump